MSMGEIIVILIIAVLVLGPEKLPSTAVQIAKILKALKKQVDDAKESIEKEIRVSEIKKEADKYKNEFSEYNQNIRKKLSFEEFDELKKDIIADTQAIKDDINAIEKDLMGFNNEKEDSNSKDNLQENASQNTVKTQTKTKTSLLKDENKAQKKPKPAQKTVAKSNANSKKAKVEKDV